MDIYLQLSKHIYSAVYRKQVVLLNIISNEYISLNGKSAAFFCFILQQNFSLNQDSVFYEALKSTIVNEIEFSELDLSHTENYISLFLEKGFIEKTSEKYRKNEFASASNPIGLSKMEWVPSDKPSILKPSFFDVFKMFIRLAKIHWIINKRGLNGLLVYLNSKEIVKYNQANCSILVNKLANILDLACVVFPKKTLCLPWASTFLCAAVSNRIPCDFVIGVQTAPFYAHAWIEYNGEVVNEDREVQEKLAPILKLSFR